MRRISSDMPRTDMQHHMRLREWKMNDMQNKISEQTRVRELRDDPISAAHSTRYQSYISRLERYSRNIESTQGVHRVAEGYMREGVDILQRVREIAVQGANGSFTPEDMKYMGEEVNELLGELVNIGNARGGDGTTLFSGDRTRTIPFRAVMGNAPGGDRAVITGVDYVGTIERNRTEIGEGAFMNVNFPGNRIFWAEDQQLFSDVEATAYQVQETSVIRIDGTEIDLKAGDTVQAIISRINDAGVPVRARLDPVKNSLVLQSTTPHQLWLEDVGGGTVLTDLGVLSDPQSPPPQNIASSARAFGGSLFDMVIHLRDSLYQGSSAESGGRALRGIDSALSNLLGSLGELGGSAQRMEITYARLSMEMTDMTDRNSKEVDLDMAKAITDLKMYEYTHKAALGAAGRILQPTLLDFLR